MNQFNFSENHIRKTNRIMLIMFPFLVLCALGFALFVSDSKISEIIIPLCSIFDNISYPRN